jgi:hypothetical protein
VQGVAEACGLQIDAHLLSGDRSWWPQIASQLRRTPAERVRQVTPPRVFFDVTAVLDALVHNGAPAIVIGELAGALHGWPLVLSGEAIEVCTPQEPAGAVLERLGASVGGAGIHKLRSDGRLAIIETPTGTSGYGDLARSAEAVDVGDGTVVVAGLLDLLRIADASPDRDARRHALAYGAVLDVQRAQAGLAPAGGRTDEERIDGWLSEQIPVA